MAIWENNLPQKYIVDEVAYDIKRHWRRVQELVIHFWHRWLREWIPSLSPRQKWFKLKKDVKSGVIVLVVSSDTPRGQWPLGRILEVHQGKDGHVGSVRWLAKTVLKTYS